MNAGKMQKVLAVLRREGAGALARKIFRRFVSVKTAILFSRPLDSLPEMHSRMPVTMRKMEIGDLAALERIGGGEKAALFKKRLEENKVCFLALAGGVIVHYSWLSFASEYESWSGVTVPVMKGEAYVFDVHTFPAYRGRDIAPAVFAEQMKFMKQNGCTTALILVGSGNIQSLRSTFKTGYSPRKVIKLLHLFGLRITLFARTIPPGRASLRIPGGIRPRAGKP